VTFRPQTWLFMEAGLRRDGNGPLDYADGMDQRISLLTLAVDDLRRARACYEQLGWRGQEVQETVVFQAGGIAVVLANRTPTPTGWSLHNLPVMRRIFVTGMSGTGKSSVLAELGRRGFRVIDTDEGGWTEWSDAEGGYVWREDRMTALLADDDGPSLYVSGTVSNQRRFYHGFDAIVLLSAPSEVLLSRIESRRNNPYGKSPEQQQLILQELPWVEPLLRRSCTHEIDTTQPLLNVVQQLVELGREPSA
jgi:shikimate kinase